MATEVLHRAGLQLGENLFPPHPTDNPHGYSENADFVKTNDIILSGEDAAWDSPPEIGCKFFSAPIQYMQNLVAEMNEPWGWKDPRTSLTLPIWRKVLPGLVTVIVI